MQTIWSEQLSVGNATIDLDHRIILGLINGVTHAIECRDCSILSQAFELLDKKLRSHFQKEEHIAQAVKFSFSLHKQAQQHFLTELGHLKNELLCKDGLWCDEAAQHFSDLLRELMMDHILGKDMLMKPMLQKHPYEPDLFATKL